MTKTFLKVNDIKKSFAGVHALKGVDLSIDSGEVCCLVGENGCGKSTLIKIIAGVYTPDSGIIEIDGECFAKLHPMDAKRKGIEVIYQDFSVFPNLTVAENIAMNKLIGDNAKFVNKKDVNKIAREALARINVSMDIAEYVGELSVANKQLVAIARALVNNSKLIIMDEATSALTRKEVDRLFEIVNVLKEKGIAVLFVSHKLDEVMEIAQKVTVFRNGTHIITGSREDFDEQKITFYMTGRELENEYYEQQTTCSQENVLLRVENISQKGGFKDISFELHAGEIIGIMGPLGSGRTALANALFGLKPIECGNIYINNEKKHIANVWDAMENGIAYVPEDRLTEGLFLTRSIEINSVSAIMDKMTNKFGVYDGRLTEKEAEAQIEKLHIKVGSPKLEAQSLSGGNQQKLLMGKWMASKPQILILNGPTVGVDIGSKSDIYKIIKQLAANNMGIILISDEINEVLYNSSKIYIMNHGRFVYETAPKNAIASELLAKMSASDGSAAGAIVQ